MAIIVGSFVLAAVVGVLDEVSSAFIAFSIFYMIPVYLASWFGNRTLGIVVAAWCAIIGFVADLSSLDALGVDPVYAVANLGLRLILFGSTAIVVSRLRVAMLHEKEASRREREAAEREHEAAERLADLNAMKDQLMRSVVSDAREPLGDIYARVVSLGFDMPKLTMGESQEALYEIADASRRLSELVNTLLEESRAAEAASSPHASASS